MTLEADVEALRKRISDTQELYREVCMIQFFRYGETPTANKLYQLVRKGSMSAPAKALRDFWTNVRDKTKVDVGQPDLPSDVATAAGELAANLWRLANQAAGSSLEVFREDAQREIEVAQAHTLVMVAERDAISAAAEDASRRTEELRVENAKLLTRLTELETTKIMLTDQLTQSKNESAEASRSLSDARRDFAEELGKLREMHNQSEQRLVATEKRALLEIDSERTVTRQMRQQLQSAQERMASVNSEHLAERDQLRDALATTKTQLAAATTRCASVEQELESNTFALKEQIDAAACLRDQIDAQSKQMRELRRPATLPRPPRPTPIPRKTRVRRSLKFSDIPRQKSY
jgi:hypothetical protein